MRTLLIAVVLSAGLSAQVQPAAVPPVTDLTRRILAVTGPAPRECGRHQLRRVGGKTVDVARAALQTSMQCVREAIAARQPFWTFVERRAIDSFVAHGLLRTANGAVQFFEYDSSPCGGPACGGDLTLEPCANPSVKSDSADRGAPDFECRQP